MSQPTVSRWFRGFKQLLKYRQHKGKETVKFVGQDHLGNKYYETYRPNHIRPNQRYFDRPNMDSFEHVVDAAHVPPLWDSWLRYRRQEPPTEDEVRESEGYFKMQQALAAERKAQEMGESKENMTDKQPNPSIKRSPKRREEFPFDKNG